MIARRTRRAAPEGREEHMHFDLAAIPQSDAYKLLVSTAVLTRSL